MRDENGGENQDENTRKYKRVEGRESLREPERA